MYAPTVPAGLSAALRARIEASIPSLHGWNRVLRLVDLSSSVAGLSVELGVRRLGTISLAIGHEALGHGYSSPSSLGARCFARRRKRARKRAGASLDHEAIFLKALADSRVASLCLVLRQRSDVAVAEFEDRSIGVLHQDSNHSELISSAEVELWAPKLRAGGLWIADDTDWPTTQRAQALLIRKGFAVIEDHAAWKVFRKDS
jgi:hypothetical protein